MTLTFEAPDVNAPYPDPPVLLDEYRRRLELAISRTSWPERVGLEIDRDILARGPWDDEGWRHWYFWQGKDFDEWGQLPEKPVPACDRTSECLSDAQLAERIGWKLRDIEGTDGIGTDDGMWLREGDDLWRFYIKQKAAEMLLAAE